MVLEIFFAAGCFWGVEKNFENIEGVIDVVSGYSGGNYENPSYEDVLNNRIPQTGTFLDILKNIGLQSKRRQEMTMFWSIILRQLGLFMTQVKFQRSL